MGSERRRSRAAQTGTPSASCQGPTTVGHADSPLMTLLTDGCSSETLSGAQAPNAARRRISEERRAKAAAAAAAAAEEEAQAERLRRQSTPQERATWRRKAQASQD